MTWKRRILLSGLVLCAVCLITAVLALANVIGMRQLSSFQPEAKTNLGAIFTAQVAYFGENNGYAGLEDCFKDISWGPSGACAYAYHCGKVPEKENKPAEDLVAAAGKARTE